LAEVAGYIPIWYISEWSLILVQSGFDAILLTWQKLLHNIHPQKTLPPEKEVRPQWILGLFIKQLSKTM